MLLSQTAPAGAALTPHLLSPALVNMATHMFSQGWTVIGSLYKTPRLHPWKEPDRQQLLEWAITDLKTGAANSLNLRLSDTGTIALDCDFASRELTDCFLDSLAHYLAMPRKSLYTCAGARGCKVFFHCDRSGFVRRLPQTLGPGLTSVPAGLKADTVLEIKTTVSTFAGMHSFWGSDGIVYGPYPGTRFIACAAPSQLPSVNHNDIDMIEELYTRIVSAARAFYVPAQAPASPQQQPAAPAPYMAPGYYQVTAAAVAWFLEYVPAEEYPGITQGGETRAMSNYRALAPLLEALGLYDALGYLAGVYEPDELSAALTAPAPGPDIQGELRREFETNSYTRYQLHNRATRAEALMRDLHRQLRRRALAAGLESAAMFSTRMLYKILYEHNLSGGAQ